MKFKRFLAFGIPLIITFLLFFPYKHVIAFSFEDQGKLVAYLPLESEKNFRIKYTHSIHLSDVLESYRFSDKQIIQTEFSYHDFAVGMPSNAEGKEVFEEKDGTYFIKNMKRNFTYIDLRVGQVRANHRLVYDEKTYTLADFIKPGTWVRISLESISLWEQLKGVKISG
ncbi:DUF1850 domain-containing protein [Peribacillus simplex]|uniref:DUF1850 domain-containing protein n=1 Tax=Peribacillus simplex TaxID=1478 RepID=UPI00203E88FA|nr:DUF1850 domain-containing protein [Peribacillus simplex]MCM3674494.1 DUF1850 domain-containing protein [Peribacillus simplex]